MKENDKRKRLGSFEETWHHLGSFKKPEASNYDFIDEFLNELNKHQAPFYMVYNCQK